MSDQDEPERVARKTSKPVTLKDLAERLELSPATVSLALNRSRGAEGLAEETKRRVLAAAQEAGYRPNQLARSLRSQRSYSVGVLVRDVVDTYAAVILAGLERCLRRAGYLYFITSHQQRGELRDEYLQLLRDRAVDGYLLINTTLEESPALPAVTVSGHRSLPGVTNVVIDHDRAAQLALGHLVELGHRRIAFFRGHPESADTEDRWRAIVQAAGQLDLPIDDDLVLELGCEKTALPEEGYEEGYAFGRQLLRGGVPFTALFGFDDVSAIGAVRALLDVGLEVPGDVSVLGFDDIPSAAFQNPALSTIRQPLSRMGELAGEILLDHVLDRQRHPEWVCVEPELIVRASTGPAPAHA